MSLLSLKLLYFAQKFVSLDSLFLTYPLGSPRDNELIAAFNEPEALGSSWLPDIGAAPEVFHEAISSLMIAEGLNAVLLSFESRMRDVRTDLSQLDLDKAAGSQIVALRNRLLGVSREVSIVCRDVTVLVDDAARIWRDLLPLAWLQPTSGTAEPTETTADAKRRQLRRLMESLQTHETGLRDLILVTSQSINETRNLALANTLKWLTIALALLTAALVFLGVVQAVHPATVTVNVTPMAPAGSPTPGPTSSPAPGSGS